MIEVDLGFDIQNDWYKGGDPRNAVKIVVPDGNTVVVIGPYLGVGSFKPAAREMNKRWPTRWQTSDEAETALTFQHFRFMQAGKNEAGRDYPVRHDVC